MAVGERKIIAFAILAQVYFFESIIDTQFIRQTQDVLSLLWCFMALL